VSYHHLPTRGKCGTLRLGAKSCAPPPSRPERVKPLFTPAQLALEIPPAVSDGDNLYLRFENAKGDGHPALESDRAQTRQDVITACTGRVRSVPCWRNRAGLPYVSRLAAFPLRAIARRARANAWSIGTLGRLFARDAFTLARRNSSYAASRSSSARNASPMTSLAFS
jgi:hypothetical protein